MATKKKPTVSTKKSTAKKVVKKVVKKTKEVAMTAREKIMARRGY